MIVAMVGGGISAVRGRRCAGQSGVARSRLIDLTTADWLHNRSLLNCADLTSCYLLLSNTPPLA
ncbi:uncharacterized protein M421DRAFT_424213 [Didymella exigua CBS 183.55]|uniref:Uncharacterized protein n=1 Tax=Didymella exigua CBS 183.55 TaxID=1150837 RepID=A0A6A5RHA6_9PLEO|nr:uncharacterized protein M421DRAFT_424213 [Didymella exigua CBS 183.55]KAF1924987.1 hypothetical protein M421DRAFT_424213 [Didymella exigua CBS 183.55]